MMSGRRTGFLLRESLLRLRKLKSTLSHNHSIMSAKATQSDSSSNSQRQVNFQYAGARCLVLNANLSDGEQQVRYSTHFAGESRSTRLAIQKPDQRNVEICADA